MKTPCRRCPTLAICKNKDVVHCRILFRHYIRYDRHRTMGENRDQLDLYKDFLNKAKWVLAANGNVVLYSQQEVDMML